MIPTSLTNAVSSLKFESPSDERLAKHAITHPEQATPATIAWLAALVSRKGARYDDNNPEHRQAHTWPLASATPPK